MRTPVVCIGGSHDGRRLEIEIVEDGYQYRFPRSGPLVDCGPSAIAIPPSPADIETYTVRLMPWSDRHRRDFLCFLAPAGWSEFEALQHMVHNYQPLNGGKTQ